MTDFSHWFKCYDDNIYLVNGVSPYKVAMNASVYRVNRNNTGCLFVMKSLADATTTCEPMSAQGLLAYLCD